MANCPIVFPPTIPTSGWANNAEGSRSGSSPSSGDPDRPRPSAAVPQAAALFSRVRILEKKMRMRISTSSNAVLTACPSQGNPALAKSWSARRETRNSAKQARNFSANSLPREIPPPPHAGSKRLCPSEEVPPPDAQPPDLQAGFLPTPVGWR